MTPVLKVGQAMHMRMIAATMIAFVPLALQQESPPVLAGQPYKSRAGPFPVQTVERVTLRDETRGKDLRVFVSYPKGEGPFPVIVFSHGALGSGDMGFPIVRHWTGHGYVVFCPTHADSLLLRRERGLSGARSTIEEIRTSGQGGGWDANWIERPGDVSLVFDSLERIENEVPELKGKLDRKHMGAGGHSLGAYTAQVAGGATIRVPGKDEPQSFADDRIRAVLQLSGQGTGQQGLHKDSWKTFDLPMMCVTGSLDRAAQGQEPLWRREPFAYSPPGGKYFVYIEGAHHGSFVGRVAEGIETRRTERSIRTLQRSGLGAVSQAEIFEWVKQAATAFWDAYLKEDKAAGEWLRSESLATLSAGRVKLEVK